MITLWQAMTAIVTIATELLFPLKPKNHQLQLFELSSWSHVLDLRFWRRSSSVAFNFDIRKNGIIFESANLFVLLSDCFFLSKNYNSVTKKRTHVIQEFGILGDIWEKCFKNHVLALIRMPPVHVNNKFILFTTATGTRSDFFNPR